KIHRVIYERLVADPETEIRRLLEHVGLPFEDGCLQFHANRRAIDSASSEQVRTPIFTDAIEQWRHYEPWLEPLKQSLGPALGSWRHSAADRM
ncbi:MAG TPA: sulfotransferase, partial [Rhizomicrobium sp.]